MGKPKRGSGNFELFNHPNTVRRCKRRGRKKVKQEIKEFYDVKECGGLSTKNYL